MPIGALLRSPRRPCAADLDSSGCRPSIEREIVTASRCDMLRHSGGPALLGAFFDQDVRAPSKLHHTGCTCGVPSLITVELAQ
jgi:hypothetical protein